MSNEGIAGSQILYIGWIPVLLAAFSLQNAPSRLKHLVWTFLAAILLVFLISTADLMVFLAERFPFLTQLRHLTIANGLAVPFILGLSAIGLDQLIHMPIPHINIKRFQKDLFSLPVLPPVMLVVSALAVVPVYNFTQPFLNVNDVSYYAYALDFVWAKSAEWITVPIPGTFDWVTQAETRGFKIGDTWRPWHWANYPNLKGYVEVIYGPDYKGKQIPYVKKADYLFFLNPEAEYALITTTDHNIILPCLAESHGGAINLTCSSPSNGTMIVRENYFDGWQAYMDGNPIPLQKDRFLKIYTQPGTHTYSFRYQPVDVPIGLVVTLIGVILCIGFYWKVKN